MHTQSTSLERGRDPEMLSFALELIEVNLENLDLCLDVIWACVPYGTGTNWRPLVMKEPSLATIFLEGFKKRLAPGAYAPDLLAAKWGSRGNIMDQFICFLSHICCHDQRHNDLVNNEFVYLEDVMSDPDFSSHFTYRNMHLLRVSRAINRWL